MEQLPLGDGNLNIQGRSKRTPNTRGNIPLPVIILGAVALAIALFCVVVLVKMGSPAPMSEVEAEISL